MGVGSYTQEFDGAYAIVQIKDTLNDTYEFAELMMVDDDNRVFMTEYGNIVTGAGATTGIGTISGEKGGHGDCDTEIKFVPNANIPVEVKTVIHALKVTETSSAPTSVDLNAATIQTKFDVYEGTFFGARTKFPILDVNDNEIFKVNFDGSDSDIVDLTNNQITIPNHFFVSGEGG